MEEEKFNETTFSGIVKYPTKEIKVNTQKKLLSIGFLMQNFEQEVPGYFQNKWFNYSMEINPENKKALEEIRSKLRGAKVEFMFDGIEAINLMITKIAPKSENKAASGSLAKQLEKVNYKTLMAEAHKIGIQSTSVELVPELTNMSEKKACFKAVVIIARKTVTKQSTEEIQYQTFEDYGEACGSDNEEGNIDSKQIRPAYIRMASTRALVRALRQATNNMETAEEEMPDGKLPSDK